MRTLTDEEGRLEVAERTASLLDGFMFDHVDYLIPTSMVGMALTHGAGFEHAEAGIRLVGADGEHRTIRWTQGGFDEGLWIGVDPKGDDEFHWVPDVTPVAADSWKSAGLGSRVVRSTVGWQQLTPSQFSVWSVRLELDRGSVVVCLGEMDDVTGEPTYIPDCVIVVFDEQLARRYQPIASSVSAWTTGRHTPAYDPRRHR